MPKNRQTLPAGRAARIELARGIVGHACTVVNTADKIILQTERDIPTFEACVRYTSATVEALLAAGFPSVTSGSPIGGHDRPECAACFELHVSREEV